MIGKTIEVIAFEIDGNDKLTGVVTNAQTIENIREKYDRLPRISHDSYKFDRDEANDYE